MKITDAFLGEHAVFYAQFSECEDLIGRADLASLKDASAVISSALVSHARLEDALIFGPLAARMGEQHSIFMLMEEEHQAIAALLGQISTARTAERAGELLREMIHAARHHFSKEEQVAFPLAEQLLGVDELRRAGHEWAEARSVVGALLSEQVVNHVAR